MEFPDTLKDGSQLYRIGLELGKRYAVGREPIDFTYAFSAIKTVDDYTALRAGFIGGVEEGLYHISADEAALFANEGAFAIDRAYTAYIKRGF